ncbi:hypothetical protein [Vreelandella venusta]|uniref:hypothetical protein n=1 Tax=Vreelandella venusta TaxID=44935 RepID=UPI0020105F21|nr:hypothetical protein [Halomonas venusta]UQI42493.1 hypothetical protein M3L73_09605 [Halomonas venusta]
MQFHKPRVFKDEPSVNQRLNQLELSREKLLEVRTQAMSAAADATPFHPANAAGLFAYLQGVAALRRLFVGDEWRIERLDNMEFIRNDSLKIRVGFSNIKIASEDDSSPKARSPRGAAAERACSHTFDMFDHLLPDASPTNDDITTYFFMMDSRGAAELSCPTVEFGNYYECYERIYISDGSDFDIDPLLNEDGDTDNTFDPVVARR